MSGRHFEHVSGNSDRFEVVVSPWEARMSLWIDTPRIVEKVSGRTILDFKDVRWSLDEATWRSDSIVELWLRKYPGSHSPTGVCTTVDCLAMTAQVGEISVALRDVEATLDGELAWPQPEPVVVEKGLSGFLKRLYRIWRGQT